MNFGYWHEAADFRAATIRRLSEALRKLLSAPLTAVAHPGIASGREEPPLAAPKGTLASQSVQQHPVVPFAKGITAGRLGGVRSVIARDASDGQTRRGSSSTRRRSRVMAAWRPIGRRKCLADIFCSAKSGMAADMGSATNQKPGFRRSSPHPVTPLAKDRAGCTADDSGAARSSTIGSGGLAVTPAGIALSQAERWDSIPSIGYTYSGKLLAA
jgi:hypothetical protein